MTVTDQIFRKVAEASIPHFFITEIGRAHV